MALTRRGLAVIGLLALSACTAAGPPAVQTIPDLVPPTVSADDLTFDSALGAYRSRTRLLVMLARGADTSRVVPAVLAAAPAGTTILGGRPGLALMMLRVPESELTRGRDAIAAVAGVQVVVEDWALGPEMLYPEPDALHRLPSTAAGGQSIEWTWETTARGSNWWLEAMRMPGAWNWNDAIQRNGGLTSVGVLEGGGAMVDHHELTGLVTNVDSAPVRPHATLVAGIIAANSGDREGMSGVSPFARLAVGTLHAQGPNDLTTFGDIVMYSLGALLGATTVRVVNISQGMNWYARQTTPGGPVPVPPDLRLDQQHIVERQAQIALRQALDLATGPRPVFLVTSAGNDGYPAGDIPATATPEVRQQLLAWQYPDARWNNPYCYAAIMMGAPNVYCVEALQYRDDGALARWPSSDRGGTIAAPGEAVLSTMACTGDECSVGPRGYAVASGTSLASPMVAGLIAHMLAFNPELTVADVQTALVSTARPSAGGAPAVDAFAAMTRLPTGSRGPTDALLALFDVDDGTADGCTRDDPTDRRGDGRVDARDFRRVRDALLWDRGIRAHLQSGAERDHKLDHNRDGAHDDMHPEVWSRFDFDGDGLLTDADLAALGASPVWSDPMPGRSLRDLLLSGDLVVDPSAVWIDGITAIELQAVGTPYALTIHRGDAGPFIYTVTAGASMLSVHVVGAGNAPADRAFEIAPGEDQPLVLTAGPPTTVTCPPGIQTTLTGSVVDAANHGIAGASVVVANLPTSPPDTLQTTTGSNGTFRIVVPASDALTVTVGCHVYTNVRTPACALTAMPVTHC